MVVTTNGDRQYGLVRRNDASEVSVVTGPNQEVHIARKEVTEMRPARSPSCPPALPTNSHHRNWLIWSRSSAVQVA